MGQENQEQQSTSVSSNPGALETSEKGTKKSGKTLTIVLVCIALTGAGFGVYSILTRTDDAPNCLLETKDNAETFSEQDNKKNSELPYSQAYYYNAKQVSQFNNSLINKYTHYDIFSETGLKEALNANIHNDEYMFFTAFSELYPYYEKYDQEKSSLAYVDYEEINKKAKELFGNEISLEKTDHYRIYEDNLSFDKNSNSWVINHADGLGSIYTNKPMYGIQEEKHTDGTLIITVSLAFISSEPTYNNTNEPEQHTKTSARLKNVDDSQIANYEYDNNSILDDFDEKLFFNQRVCKASRN